MNDLGAVRQMLAAGELDGALLPPAGRGPRCRPGAGGAGAGRLPADLRGAGRARCPSPCVPHRAAPRSAATTPTTSTAGCWRRRSIWIFWPAPPPTAPTPSASSRRLAPGGGELGRHWTPEEENESTAALVRGMAAQAAQRGFPVAGFDAYAVSDVLPGSGLSSSAACEVLLGVIVNHLFCRDRAASGDDRPDGPGGGERLLRQAERADGPDRLLGGGRGGHRLRRPSPPVVRSVAVDLNALGYALCIIDSGASHADLTGEYDAIPQEMRAVAAFSARRTAGGGGGRQCWPSLPQLRKAAGDRAVLRALHFFADDGRVEAEADALARGDMDAFLALVKESGRSSWTLLQNITPTGAVQEQAMAVALTVAERALKGRGACRVHGGGFAGTIQAFVPLDCLEDFRTRWSGPWVRAAVMCCPSVRWAELFCCPELIWRATPSRRLRRRQPL